MLMLAVEWTSFQAFYLGNHLVFIMKWLRHDEGESTSFVVYREFMIFLFVYTVV